MYGRAKQEVPYWHRQGLHPNVANERAQELEQQVDCGLDSETPVWQWPIMPLRFRVDRVSKH